MRKLILKDKDGCLTEFDQKALRREALALKSYIETAAPGEESMFHYREKLMPLVDVALQGRLQSPFKGISPYNQRLIMEGLEPDLPKPIADLYFRFLGRIEGWASLSSTSVDKNGNYVPDVVEAGGQHYEWVEFED